MIWLAFVLLIVGFIVLVKGADFLVNGASSIAKKFNISNLAIGLTVVAFGTSAPELMVNVISALSNKGDAAFGNVIGSNNFNLLFILGISGMIYPLVVQRNTIKFEIPLSLLAAVLLFVLVNDQLLRGQTENILSRIDAFILLILFVFFLFYIYRTMKQSEGPEEENIKVYSTLTSTMLTVLGLLMLVGGGKLVVDNAINIASHFGLSERLIGLTILAAGTSLPELATSAVAAYRKNTDIAIGNVVGSNLFNILFILGITGSITPTPYNPALNTDLLILFISTVVLMIFMFTLRQRRLDRWEAVLMFVSYIVYTGYLIATDV